MNWPPLAAPGAVIGPLAETQLLEERLGGRVGGRVPEDLESGRVSIGQDLERRVPFDRTRQVDEIAVDPGDETIWMYGEVEPASVRRIGGGGEDLERAFAGRDPERPAVLLACSDSSQVAAASSPQAPPGRDVFDGMDAHTFFQGIRSGKKCRGTMDEVVFRPGNARIRSVCTTRLPTPCGHTGNPGAPPCY